MLPYLETITCFEVRGAEALKSFRELADMVVEVGVGLLLVLELGEEYTLRIRRPPPEITPLVASSTLAKAPLES